MVESCMVNIEAKYAIIYQWSHIDQIVVDEIWKTNCQGTIL